MSISTEFQTPPEFDLHMLRQGDRIQVSEPGASHYSGVVDLIAPSLGIIWLRQDGLGERKLILCPDYLLQQSATSHWDLKIFGSKE